jgi:hypothetical protein
MGEVLLRAVFLDLSEVRIGMGFLLLFVVVPGFRNCRHDWNGLCMERVKYEIIL